MRINEDWSNLWDEFDSEQISEEVKLEEGPSGQTAAKKAAWIGLGGTVKTSNGNFMMNDEGMKKINMIIDGCARANDPDINFPDWIVIHHLNGDHSDNSAGNRVIMAAHWHNLLGIKMAEKDATQAEIEQCIKRVCSIARKNHMLIFDYDEACKGNVVELVWGGWKNVPDMQAGGGYLAHDYLQDALYKVYFGMTQDDLYKAKADKASKAEMTQFDK